MKTRYDADPVIDHDTKPRSVDLHIPLPNDNDAYVYFGKRPTKEDIDTLTRHLMLVKETLDPELPPVLPAAQPGKGAPTQTIARARRWHGPHLTPEQEADIARRYPEESQERLAAVYNVPLNHIRMALMKHNKSRKDLMAPPLTEEQKAELKDLYPAKMTLQQVRAHFGYPPMQRIHQALDEFGIVAPGTRRRQKPTDGF